MKDINIAKFGQKLMVSSQSINKIPEEYLKLAQNARIYDWWIWPAKWKQLVVSSTLWTNNKGAFFLNWVMYQITNSNIYSVIAGVQTSIVSLWYDVRTDILVYWKDFAIIVAEWEKLKVFDGTDIFFIQMINYINEVWAINIWDTIVWGTSWASWEVLSNDGIEDILYIKVTNDIAFVLIEDLEVLTVKKAEVWSILNETPNLDNSWIIEYTRWFSFITKDNILYISRPITAANPEYAYDFTWTWSENITFDSNITGLQATMSWIYIFTEDTVEYIGANSLQNVAWSATFISTPLWSGWEPVNNTCITSSWDKIFYITKNQEVRTINYIPWTSDPTIWELSAQPVIWIKELLNDIAIIQPTAFAFENSNDNTIHFHIRTKKAWFNDITLVYDMINTTWAIDKGRNYNYIINTANEYYGFSDINSSIYQDDIWTSMAWSPIPFRIITQELNQWTILQKRYWWLFTAWAIWAITSLTYIARIDWWWVFEEVISWTTAWIEWLWEIWGATIWWEPLWGDLLLDIPRQPFDRIADEGRIYQDGKRIQIEIRSASLIQDFIIDILWIRAEKTIHSDISDKF